MAQADEILAFIEKAQNPNVGIDEAKCLKVRNRNNSCSRCVDACPANCILIENNHIAFDGASCLGCLTCTSVCPTGALRSKVKSDTAVFTEASSVMTFTPGQVVFLCEELGNAAKGFYDDRYVVPVKCAAAVDLSMLVYLVHSGAKHIVFATGKCEECKRGACMQTALNTIETAKTLLETWNATAKIEVTAKLPSNTKKVEDLGYNTERRGFFSDVRVATRRTVADASSVAMDNMFDRDERAELIGKIKVNDNGTLPLLSNARRARLLAALDSFGEPQDVMINTGLWRQAIIDPDKCRACRICATFCPSGALFKFHTKSGKIGVKQIVRDCIGCGCCEDVCFRKALTLDSEVFARDIAEGTAERYEMDEPKPVSKFTFNF